MKSEKLIDIYKQGHIVIPIYLLQHYKELKVTLEEFLFLMYLYSLGDHFLFNPQQFSETLNLSLEEVMNLVSKLTEKHLIRVEVVKNEKGFMEEVLDLKDFYHKISYFMVEDVNQSLKVEDSTIFEIVEQEFGRTLSPMECEIIKAWLDGGMVEGVIKEAIKEATFNGVSNLRYIDKILYEWGKNGIKTVDDVEKMRKKRKARKKEQDDAEIDMELVDWKWFDEDE